MSKKIVFMGTPKFSVQILETLVNSDYEICCVYTQPPKKSFRGKKINSLIFYLIIISFYLTIYLGVQLVKINQSDDGNTSRNNFAKERETYFKAISIKKDLYKDKNDELWFVLTNGNVFKFNGKTFNKQF